MSFTQTVEVTGRFPDPNAIEREFSSPELLSRIGNAVAGVIKENFIQLNAERSSGYGGMGGYYEGAARGTGYTTAFGYSEVLVKQIGIAVRLYGTDILPGGMLNPKNAKYLAIPNSFSGVISQVYGRSPTEFANLKVVFGRQKSGDIGPIALKADEGGAWRQNHVKDHWTGDYIKTGPSGKKVRAKLNEQEIGMAQNVGKKTKSSEGEILFWLAKEVYQSPDARVIPRMDVLESSGYDAAKAWLDHITPTSITISA